MTIVASSDERLPGVFVTIDGPGGVGKSTVAQLLVKALDDRAIPVHATVEPTRTTLGNHIRANTDTYRGAALACLVAGDRHQHLASEILPALRAGQVVVCDRYLPSSLVLQRLDGLSAEYIWQLNAGIRVPDVCVILNGDHPVIAERLRARGAHSRFERTPDISRAEADLYLRAATDLQAAGWPVMALDATIGRAESIAHTIALAVLHAQQPEPGMSQLSLLTFNIGNPSLDRAQRQLNWLASRDEDVLVLTETKDSAGCRLLAEKFTAAGYHVAYPVPENGDYGVLIASKIPAHTDDFGSRVGYLPSRAAAITLHIPNHPVQVIGAYVPSRDASPEKIDRKRTWLGACHTALASRTDGSAVFLGDLNILEPSHKPHYAFFAPFEYDFYEQLTDACGLVDAFRARHPDAVEHSWVGRTGDGYRYDHAHCTADLASRLADCAYLHQPRLDRLSDHSALTVRLTLDPGERLITSDPAAADEPPTLF